MAWWTRATAWLKRETAEASEAKAEVTDQLDADLTRREQQLDETPEEAMRRIQAEIADTDATLHALGSQPDPPTPDDTDPSDLDT